LGEIEDGYIVTTSAGNLRASYLLHMVVKVPSWTMIQSAVTNCLNHAEFCGFTSLAVPAVGTGKLHGSVKLSAEILHSCIEEYRKREEKSLKLIRIVILHENVFADFKKAFALAQEATMSTDFKGKTKLD
jgi:O-acetyl-ADP-ribose deacetylase (regulator of RNase III)